MLLFSHAKINLGLHVLNKRSDGFHNIETVMMPIGWCDLLEVMPAQHFALHCSGLAVDAAPEQNLCTRAFRLLQRELKLPEVDIFLHKQVPTGAGLGGGSSNAACTLQALNEQLKLSLSTPALAGYAAQLGSDCAFFVHHAPMLATGRGDVLQPIHLKLSGYELLVVKPPFGVSTAEAYAGVHPQLPQRALQEVIAQDVEAWRDTLHNDFEPSVFAQHPSLLEAKQRMYELGAAYASMSGSGSAVYGLFRHLPRGAAQGFAGWTTFCQPFDNTI
jgi:4-diphosphocytidyl-2-C-methyl-D-erythritol kinase